MKTTGTESAPQAVPTPDPTEQAALDALRHGIENPDDTTPLDDITPGEEIDDTIEDDAERDERLAREAEAAAAGKPTQKPTAAAGKAAATKPTGTPAAKPDSTAGAQPKAGEPPAQTPEQAAAARNAEIDKEADALQLKPNSKARERFHEMSRQIAERDEALGALSALVRAPDGDDRPVVERIAERIRRADEFEEGIFSIADENQLSQFAGYMTAINSADVDAWQQARDFLRQELAWLEGPERLNVATPDGAELFEAHPDLKEKVETGRMDPEDANETARLRNLAATGQRVRETTTQVTQLTAAQQRGQSEAVAFAQKAGAEDPQRWAAVWPQLQPQVREIQKKFPPEQWAEKIELAYYRTPYTPQPAPATTSTTPNRVRVGRVDPVRTGRPAAQPSGAREMEREETDPMAALRAGIESASR